MPTLHDCRCKHTGNKFRGFLRHRSDGEGLALYCAMCGGWVEDSWLYTDDDGIPVKVEMEVSRDYASGEDLVLYGLVPENERLVSALERTERNLLLSIRQRPVRDLCENLAENAAALQGR